MNVFLKRQLIMAVLLLGVLGFGINLRLANCWGGPGDFTWGGPLHQISFYGTLYAPEQKKEAGPGPHITLKLLASQEEWFFKVKEVQGLTGDLNGSGLLELIFPPILRLRGPNAVIEALQKPEILGEPVKIDGDLYIATRILQVDSIENLNK